MRQVSVKKLKNDLCKELFDLPFEITKYGKVVATIYKGSHHLNEKVVAITSKDKGKAKGSHGSTIKPLWVNPLDGSALAPKK